MVGMNVIQLEKKWKGLLLLILAQLCVGQVKADYMASPDFLKDGIYYKINEDGVTVAVDFRGNLSLVGISHGCYSGDVTIPETVEYENTTYTVTGLKKYAFYFCNVTSVSLPSTLKFIEVEAFRGCKLLTSLQLPTDLTKIGSIAFAESGIQSLVLPDQIEDLPNDLFRSSEIASVTLPFSLKTMGKEIFRDCKKLTSITIPNGVEEIPWGAFGNSSLEEIALPANLKTIGDYAFYSTPLSQIQIPNSVDYIGEYAFYGCKFVSFHFPSSLQTIGKCAFYRNTSLDNVVMGHTQLKTIGESAFQECSLLQEIDGLPNTLESIGGYAFCDDKKLLLATIPASTTSIGGSAFKNCTAISLTLLSPDYIAGEAAFTGVKEIHVADVAAWVNAVVSNLLFDAIQVKWPPVYDSEGAIVEEYIIPEGVESIEHHMYNNKYVKRVIFPQSMKSIGMTAFSGCDNLEYVELNGVEQIGRNAFASTNLKTVKFSKSIKSIGTGAFSGCNSITTVDIADVANWCQVKFHHMSSSYWDGEEVDDFYMGALESDGTVSSNPLRYTHKIVVNGVQLDELNIPKGVTSVNDFAFTGCLYFDKLNIPNTVTYIGHYAFSQCTHLEQVAFAKNSTLETLGKYAFKGCAFANITLPETLKTFDGAFRECSQLTSIDIPAGITSIGDETFYGCIGLEEVVIPEGIKTIGERAYSDCTNANFTALTLPSTLEYVGTDAFGNCKQLTGVYITDLAAYCNVYYELSMYNLHPLYYARRLYLNNQLITDLEIPEGVQQINQFTFPFLSLNSITIPESVTSIAPKAFYYCTNIKQLSLPASLTSIGSGAFSGFSSCELHIKDIEAWVKLDRTGFNGGNFDVFLNDIPVKNLVIPDGVMEISGASFRGWNIENVILPKSLERLYYGAFSDCMKLVNIYATSKFPPTLTDGSSTMSEINIGYNNILSAIYVPAGKLNIYKNSWKSHVDIIKEMEQNMSGTQSASSIAGMASAYMSLNGISSYLNLSDATLDETVTNEALQEIADQGTIIFLPEGTVGIEGTNIVANGATPKLILGDGTDFVTPYDFTAAEVVYERPFAASNTEATTLCLPYNVSILPQGMKAYAMQGKDDDGNPVFKEVDVLQAYMPYVITTTIPVENITTKNAEIKVIPPEASAPALMPDAGDNNFEFIGTLTKLSQSDASYLDAYVLGDNMQWRSVDDIGGDIPAGRAYIVPKEGGHVSFDTILQITSPYVYAAGDANSDCKVDIADAVSIINYMFGNAPEGFNKSSANVSGDVDEHGNPIITVSDAEGVVNNILNK